MCLATAIMGIASLGSQPALAQGSSAPASPASSGPVQARPNAFTLHFRQSQRLANERAWPAATAAAQAALEAARQDDNDYEQYDAAILLIRLLSQQQQYAQAGQVAKSQIAWIHAHRDNLEDVKLLLRYAIEAALAAHDPDDVSRLQQALIEAGHPYPPFWRISKKDDTLDYVLASLSVPMTYHGWTLVRFEPAETRDAPARLVYTLANPMQTDTTVELEITYREDLRGLDSQQRQAKARQALDSLLDTGPAKTGLVLPILPIDGAMTASNVRPDRYQPKQTLVAKWVALRDDWQLRVEATFSTHGKEKALGAVRDLLSAIRWPNPPRLFRETAMADQNEAIDTRWIGSDDWIEAARLSHAAIPDAVFPIEIARLNTVIGIDQYRHGNQSEAQTSLSRALQAWEYASPTYHDERLQSLALDYAADIAYRQGRMREALALNQRFLNTTEETGPTWTVVTDGIPALVNQTTDMRLPLRVDGYRLAPDGPRRFYYANLTSSPAGSIGLTTGQPTIATDDAIEKGIREFMRDTLQLRPGALKKQAFKPNPTDATGRKWVFDIAADTSATPAEHADHVPIRMVFWIVDRQAVRSILRAPVYTGDSDDGAGGKIAQAIVW